MIYILCEFIFTIVVIHEFTHLLACWLLRVSVKELILYNNEDAIGGEVVPDFDEDNVIDLIKIVFVCLAPTSLLILCSWAYLNGYLDIVSYVILISFGMRPSLSDLISVLYCVFRIVMAFLYQIGTIFENSDISVVSYLSYRLN